VGAVLLQMPPRAPGKTRINQLMYALDAGVRSLYKQTT
jgi:hypothetical protein